MAMQPADELPDYDPRPDYEGLYELAALEVGDPNIMHADWLVMARMFHALFKVWKADESYVPAHPHSEGAAAWLQYVIWYERESRRRMHLDLFTQGPALTPEE